MVSKANNVYSVWLTMVNAYTKNASLWSTMVRTKMIAGYYWILSMVISIMLISYQRLLVMLMVNSYDQTFSAWASSSSNASFGSSPQVICSVRCCETRSQHSQRAVGPSWAKIPQPYRANKCPICSKSHG